MAFLDPPKETAAPGDHGPAEPRRHSQGPHRRQRPGEPARSARRSDSTTDRAPRQPGRGDDRRPAGRGRRADDPVRPPLPGPQAADHQGPAEQGHVVGFMGDGINDAPALHAADVGISVDTAVDIAKESADMILLEKSLMVLEEGVLEGRKVFANILKYIRMGASSALRQHVQRAGGQRLRALPADGPDPDPDQQPALRLLPGCHSHRRRGPRADRQAPPLGHERDHPLHPLHRPVQFRSSTTRPTS